jgi:hypothetical protein
MVARPGTYQASFNAGELAPSVWGRSDIKQFYSGASLMQNCEPVPQGGFDALPGTRHTSYVRGAFSVLAGTLTVTGGPHAAPAVLAELVLGAPASVGAVDVTGLSASVAGSHVIVIEALVGGVWVQLGSTMTAAAVTRDRRRAFAPAAPQLASAVRLRLTSTPAAATTFAVGALVAYGEALGLPAAAREFDFTYSITEAFTAVLTPGHVDLFDGDQWIGCAALALTASQVMVCKREQRLNTMYLLHPDVAPIRLMRRDSSGDWSSEAAPFENIPLVDLGGTYGNVVNDVWRITIRYSGGAAGLALEVNVNGEDAAAVTLAGSTAPDLAAFVAGVQAALVSLPSVQPGVTVTMVSTDASATVLEVIFAGAGNAGQRFTMTARINNVTTAAATTSHTAFGDPGGEAIMSVSAGWPVTGAFYQDRLFVAGFRSEPGAVAGSVSGEYLDLNTKIENAAGAVLARLNSRGAERIEHMIESRHLVILTTNAEYYISDRAIVRTTPPNVVQSSRNGCAPLVAPVENEGGILYVGQSRAILYACSYSDVTQVYESEPLTLLASHLARGVNGMAVQKSSESTDAARLFITRDDGQMTVGIMIRNQDVTAFVRFVTDGLVRQACVDGANRVTLLVERMVAGQPRLMREIMDPAMVMHACVSFTYGSPQTVITGLGMFEGATVWVSADGYFDKSHVVTGGQLVLPYAATQVTVGRWTPPRARTLPMPRLVGERTQLARPIRVHTVRARLAGGNSLAIAANGGPARDVALFRAGDVGDQPIQPQERSISVTGLAGFSDEGFVEFTQTRPGYFAIRDITIEART